VGVRLYLPRPWTDDPERCRKARVPPEVTFQTKPALAVRLWDQARAWGVPQCGVVADADDGDNPNFLAGLEERDERSVVGVRADFQVVCTRQTIRPRPRADQVLQALPRRQWRTIRWRQGSTGWLRKKCVPVRGWRVTTEGRRGGGWGLGERTTRGQPEDRTYYGSTLPAAATLEKLAGSAQRRHAVEPFHEEAKGELGWDHDQGRLWAGFHRHAVTVMLAYSFLRWLERRQRRAPRGRGRPRDPFSPSTGPAAAYPPGGASRGRPLATPPGRAVVGDNESLHGTLLTKVLTKQYYAPLFSVVVVSATHLVRTSHPSGSRPWEGVPLCGLPPSPWPSLAPENRRYHTASTAGDHRSTGSRRGPTPGWLTA
jgi:hypothetical protein